MIVDSHRHWYPQPRAVSTRIARAMEAFFGGGGPEHDLVSAWADPGGRKLLAAMDRDGIAVSCLLVAGFGFDDDDVVAQFDRMNRATTELAEEHADRFRVYVGIHPAMAPTPRTLRRLLDNPVVAGVKMDPLGGRFDPRDEALDPVYRLCSDSGQRVVFHLGPRPDGSDPRAHPEVVSALLQRFPRLHVIGAHAAFEWWREMCEAADRHPALTCDISGLQYGASLAPDKVASVLARVLAAFGPERVLFGTDSPTFDSRAPVAGWVDYLRRLPDDHADRGLTRDAVDAVLHNRFALTGTSLD